MEIGQLRDGVITVSSSRSHGLLQSNQSTTTYMKTKVLKLGTTVTDAATGLTGTLTHHLIHSDEQSTYFFKPKGLTKDKGQSLRPIHVTAARVQGGQEVEVDVPLNVLGSKVTVNSGYKGTVISMTRHVNGCFHVQIQAEGVDKNGEVIESEDASILECKGPQIPKLSEAEKAAEIKERPSPSKGLSAHSLW